MSLSKVGTAKLDWATLGFGVVDTHSHFKMVWKDGEWDSGELVTEPYLKLHVMANALHYGQSIFEGQKVFHCKDGKVRAFCDRKNHERMCAGAERMSLPTMSWEQWQKAFDAVVRANLAYVPPYGSGASMYARPILFGSGPQVGLHPCEEVTFMIVVMPVGSYYSKGGSMKPIDCGIVEDFDRAAPRGVGSVKAAGNYAADMLPSAKVKKIGFPIGLYLDPKEGKYIEEFNSSNFIAISMDGKSYVTPKSNSILPSITNWCLEHLAVDMGLKVDRRPIDVEELSDMKEVGAAGTAVVITAVGSVTRPSDQKKWEFQQPDVLQKLLDQIKAIQLGEIEDTHGWLREIPCDP
eukprot:TRINITY_DN33451_c0_g1_i1.p1 TRINITY_DN33451_c0_g1~~TRINITY_DN33451_c0_g1_i1.p1  ORF type:complete len:350 (+),score=64.64 TRINITY_DN33451_c0_g1_i1:86-1135(+)